MIKIMVKVKAIVIYTGKYKGAAKSIFNLKYGIPKDIPVILTMDPTMAIILS